MIFKNLNIEPLFPTPFVKASFSEEASLQLNRELSALVLKKSQESKGVFVSNSRGWQSDDRITEWGGEPVKRVIEALRGLLDQITMRLEGSEYKRSSLDWRVNGWANINRKDGSNVPHVHPGAYWSAVYYVAVDLGSINEAGGELELYDPRGVTPIMYRPALRFGIPNYESAGGSQLYAPKAGQCVVFPSWLKHAVRSFSGEGTRISLAFNFSIY